MRGVRTGGMADLLGVTPQTVRKYVREGGGGFLIVIRLAVVCYSPQKTYDKPS